MFSRVRAWFSKSTPTPPPAGVYIVPCSAVDLGPRRMVVTTGFIIDARLDPKTLETTLVALVERKFPRAGARLAIRNGVYEFHVPHHFDAATPAVAFTAEDHPEPYASPDRPSIEHFLKPAVSEPWICDLPEFDSLLRSPSCPSTTDGYLAPNMPLLHVHASIFDDLTFLGVTSTHITLDALGTRALVHAWTRLIAGEPLDDIPGMPADVTPFESFNVPTKVLVRGWFRLGFFSKWWFIITFLLRIRRDPKELVKVVRVPRDFLEGKKRAIMDELQAEGSSEWVGSSDVLMAWWFKATYSYRTDAAPLHIHLPINLRELPIFPATSGSSLAPLPFPFINNATNAIALPPIPVGSFRAASLRELALWVRRAITGYTGDLASIVADLRWRCANRPVAVFPCPPGGEYAVQTSWRAARFGELDFSGAMPKDGMRDAKKKARVVFVVPMMTSNIQRPMRGGGAVLMEDEGGFWMSQVKGAKDWEVLKSVSGIEFV